MRPALIVAIGLAVFQQFIGINTIIYYAPTTLTNVGYGEASAIYANIAIGVLNVVMTVIAIRLVDRVGRKPLLIGGLLGMITSLTVLGVASMALPEPNSPGDPAAIITLLCLAGFIASFAATWGPVVWVMLPEVLPLSVRGTAMGVAIFLHWGANFLVSQTFPMLLDSFGAGPVFLGYAVIGVPRAAVRQDDGHRDEGPQPRGDRGRSAGRDRHRRRRRFRAALLPRGRARTGAREGAVLGGTS